MQSITCPLLATKRGDQTIFDTVFYFHVACTWRHLEAKVGTSKGGGKQWQPTPKKLPRMQCARAIPVA